MTSPRRLLGSLALAVTLAGCQPHAKVIDPAQLSTFHEGQACDDIIKSIGHPPSKTMRKHDGTRQFAYVSSQTVVKPESYIPVVGAFAGGGRTTSQQTLFECDAQGRLLNFSISEDTQEIGPSRRGGLR
jgi:hypothetical protein